MTPATPRLTEPYFYAAKAMEGLVINDKPTNTPSYIGFRWLDTEGRRHSQIIAEMPYEEAATYAERCNAGIAALRLSEATVRQELTEITRLHRAFTDAEKSHYGGATGRLQGRCAKEYNALMEALDALLERSK